MASFPQLNIFEQIINLPEFTVKNYRFIDGFGLVLILEKKEKKAICPHCGKKSDKLHQNYRYLVRDLPIMEHDVYLKVNRRQFKCSYCQKPFTEHFDSIKKTPKRTTRAAEPSSAVASSSLQYKALSCCIMLVLARFRA